MQYTIYLLSLNTHYQHTLNSIINLQVARSPFIKLVMLIANRKLVSYLWFRRRSCTTQVILSPTINYPKTLYLTTLESTQRYITTWHLALPQKKCQQYPGLSSNSTAKQIVIQNFDSQNNKQRKKVAQYYTNK